MRHIEVLVKIPLIAAAAASMTLFLACARESSLPVSRASTPPVRQVVGDSPQEAVEAYYRHLNAGEYSKAKQLYSEEALRAANSELMAISGGFMQWAEEETKQGAIQRVEILDSTTRGEGGRVQLHLAYSTGDHACRNVSVVRQGLSWKVGPIDTVSCPERVAQQERAAEEATWDQVLTDMRAIATAFEAYASDQNKYPSEGGRSGVELALVPVYIKRLPSTDPWGTHYKINSDGRSYAIASAGADRSFRAPSGEILVDAWKEATVSDDPGADITFQDGNFILVPRAVAARLGRQ